MRNDNQNHLPLHLEEEIRHTGGGGPIEIARRLVAQQQAGLVDQGAGNGTTLFFASGQFPRTVVEAGAQTYRVEQTAGTGGKLRIGFANQGRNQNVL